ncbi:hypothetical protein Ptr902_10487 [Pyrenophora tritici-repentis]|nr:hypothetical protein Ptr902_10487 [Pyrenophora tritici-repentis]
MATQEHEMQLFTRKISADQNGLWEYVNLDLSPEKLKMLEDERPKELEVRRFRNPLTDEQIDIPDLTATELATYNSWARRFDRDEARWLTKEKALRNLSLEILQDLIKKEQKNEEFPLIADLIAEFRSYYRRTRPIALGLGTFATLEVASSGNSNSQGSRTRTGPWTPRCLHGENHKFDNCPYVNQSVRTKGWKLDKAIQDKFTELRDSPTSNSMANALRATERGLKKKTKPQAEVQSSSMISMDDGQPARNKPHVNAVLQTAAATGLSAPPLLTRWILDPGYPSTTVYAGGALTQVEEWGETTIQVKTPTGEGQMKLTWVAYIPGFFTSVVGLSRSRSLGINFDSGRDCLYQKKASNVICLL